MEATSLTILIQYASIVLTLTTSVFGEDALIPQNCTYFPSTSYVPCKQYNYYSGTYCNEDWLRHNFSHLYEVSNPETIPWPGMVQNLDAKPEVVKWRPPTDGGVNFLRGFYVQLKGLDYESFLLNQCIIIDLTGASVAALMNTTFSVNISSPGSIGVAVSTLPPAADGYSPKVVNITKPPKVQEYYPQFSTKTITYRQVNATCVNVTVTLLPEPEAVSTLYLWVYNGTRRIVEDLSQQLTYPEDFYLIDGFTPGNFTLSIEPKDEYSWDFSRCTCYFGTPHERMCKACHPAVETQIHVQHVERDVQLQPERPTPVSVIIGAVAGSILALVVLLATAYVLIRRRLVPRSLLETLTRKRKSLAVDQFPTLKIFFVYASDHSAHSNAVKVFEAVVKSFRGFEVLGFDDAPSPVASNDSLSSGELRYGLALEQADVIVIVRSAWASALLEDMEMKTVYTSDVPSDEDCRFISCMHQLKQNSSYSSKIVSVSFDYSPKSASLLDTFPGPVYSVPSDIQTFISYLYSKCEFGGPAFTPSHDQDKERLIQAINQCSVYQRKNRSWLAKKLFLLKTYLSSDDSGVVTHRRRRKWTKSMRSKSADTVSSYRCRSESQTSQSHDRTCCYNQSRAMSQSHDRPCCYNQSRARRTLSCDLSFSFCPPESDREEDQSMCYSLLENKFVAINEKYEYILNYKLNSEDDCYTIDGKSV